MFFSCNASCVLVPGARGAQSDQGAPGGESGRAVRAGAPQAEAGVPGAGGAGSGRPSAPGLLQRRDGVLQQLGAGELDTQAAAGKKFGCVFGGVFGFLQTGETPLWSSPAELGISDLSISLTVAWTPWSGLRLLCRGDPLSAKKKKVTQLD